MMLRLPAAKPSNHHPTEKARWHLGNLEARRLTPANGPSNPPPAGSPCSCPSPSTAGGGGHPARISWNALNAACVHELSSTGGGAPAAATLLSSDSTVAVPGLLGVTWSWLRFWPQLPHAKSVLLRGRAALAEC